MKRILLVLTMISVMAAAAAKPSGSDDDYLKRIRIESKSVERHGDSVVVKMELDISAIDMKTQHSLNVVPALVSMDGKHEQPLQGVIINGRVRNKAMARAEALGNAVNVTGGPKYVGKGKKAGRVHYEDTVPFSRWMVNSDLYMRGFVTGCAACNKWDESLPAGQVLVYEEPSFEAAGKMSPKEEVVKRRADNFTARLQFKLNSYEILPDYKGNEIELARIQSAFSSTKSDENLTITGIYVEGFASPEGTASHNMALSKSRAESLTRYLQKTNKDLPSDIWHVSWHGEDWDAFVDNLESDSRYADNGKLMEVIDKYCDDPDKCEQMIIQVLSREDYDRLLLDVSAPLRRNEFRIEYNVSSLDIVQVKELMHSKPKQLSVAEIQRAADSYGEGTEAYRDALEIAVKTYPDNIEARYNLALYEISTENYVNAISILQGCTDEALLNLLGIACFKDGRFEDSVNAFSAAGQYGDGMASRNLAKVRSAIALLE